jgi:acetyltransferase-like isoleucine patch superfamily enzyme
MSRFIGKLLCLVSAALFPSPLAVMILRALGHRIGPRCRIGFSLLWVDRLLLQGGSRVGHLNFIACSRLCIGAHGYIGRTNVIAGPLSVLLRREGAIGNSNKVVRGPQGAVTVGPASLRIGRLAKVTADHRIDCTRSVRIGDYSTLAGVGIQVWTHGYVHDTTGPGRYRVDGPVAIANNVYIGASCIVSMGVELCAGVIVGAGTTVARSIDQPGLYVSSAIRRLPRPVDPTERPDLIPETDPALSERVYLKRSSSGARTTP